MINEIHFEIFIKNLTSLNKRSNEGPDRLYDQSFIFAELIFMIFTYKFIIFKVGCVFAMVRRLYTAPCGIRTQ